MILVLVLFHWTFEKGARGEATRLRTSRECCVSVGAVLCLTHFADGEAEPAANPGLVVFVGAKVGRPDQLGQGMTWIRMRALSARSLEAEGGDRGPRSLTGG